MKKEVKTINSDIRNLKGFLIVATYTNINEKGIDTKKIYQIISDGTLVTNTKYESIVIYQEVVLNTDYIIKRGETFAIHSTELSNYFKLYKDESNRK